MPHDKDGETEESGLYINSVGVGNVYPADDEAATLVGTFTFNKSTDYDYLGTGIFGEITDYVVNDGEDGIRYLIPSNIGDLDLANTYNVTYIDIGDDMPGGDIYRLVLSASLV